MHHGELIMPLMLGCEVKKWTLTTTLAANCGILSHFKQKCYLPFTGMRIMYIFLHRTHITIHTSLKTFFDCQLVRYQSSNYTVWHCQHLCPGFHGLLCLQVGMLGIWPVYFLNGNVATLQPEDDRPNVVSPKVLLRFPAWRPPPSLSVSPTSAKWYQKWFGSGCISIYTIPIRSNGTRLPPHQINTLPAKRTLPPRSAITKKMQRQAQSIISNFSWRKLI